MVEEGSSRRKQVLSLPISRLKALSNTTKIVELFCCCYISESFVYGTRLWRVYSCREGPPRSIIV